MVNFRGYKQNLTYRIPRIEGLDSRAKVRRLGDEKRAMGTRMNHHLTQMSDVYFLKGQRVPRPPLWWDHHQDSRSHKFIDSTLIPMGDMTKIK